MDTTKKIKSPVLYGSSTETIENAILNERLRQVDKFGIQNHNDEVYNAIFVEEVGEVSHAIIDQKFSNYNDNLEVEIIHCLAVLYSWLDCRYRNSDRYINTDNKKE